MSMREVLRVQYYSSPGAKNWDQNVHSEASAVVAAGSSTLVK